MKLYGSLTSPFVRACRIAAIELDLDSNVEFAPVVVRFRISTRSLSDILSTLTDAIAFAFRFTQTFLAMG